MGASGKGSNASSLESSVWMCSCRNWDWAKKTSLNRQRAVLLTYFAVRAHSEELAVIWRSPESSRTSTMLIKTLGSWEDYNHQTYIHVTNNNMIPLQRARSAICRSGSQCKLHWLHPMACARMMYKRRGRETYSGCQPKKFQQLVQTSWNAASVPGIFLFALG